MQIYPKPSTATIHCATRKPLDESASETAVQFSLTAGKRSKSKNAAEARSSIDRAEPATSTRVIRKRTDEDQEAQEVQTVSFENNSFRRRLFFRSKHLARPQERTLGSTRVYLPWNDVINIKDISFNAKAKIASISAKTYKVEDTILISRNI